MYPISVAKSLDFQKGNPRHNPSKAKFQDTSLFQINLDRKTILCRECMKSSPLSSNMMDIEVIEEVEQFKVEHEQCIIKHKAKYNTKRKRN